MFLLKYDISKQNTRKRVKIHSVKKQKNRPRGSEKTDFDWSGITLSIFVLVRKYSPEFAVANVTHKSLCCDLLLGANRRFGATKAPSVQNKKQTTRVC